MEPITKAGRRRTVLNEALHELRRPLQALALSPSLVEAGTAETSLQMAAAALERLDREINGGPGAAVRLPLAARPLVEAAVARWQPRAALRGGSLELRWEGDDATVSADRCEISQVLDNLIVNALEHGGPEVVVAAARGVGELRVSVVDSGRAGSAGGRRGGGVGPLARLRGKRRHGHGLRVVRRIAAAHGGSFRLRCAAAGAEAELELPLLGGGPG